MLPDDGRRQFTTILPAASRRGRPPTAVSPPLPRGSALPARFRSRDHHRAQLAARRRAAPQPAGVSACASASRFAGRCGGLRPSIPRRSSVVRSKL
ncbi:TPA: hypothetical protein QDE50_16475 [Burkholderia cenocepacia]|nr:hypothetical protein [Burkholderia cenocepacia]HDR9885965.1 hypothetical protein [Burkholderia cenocepacia]